MGSRLGILVLSILLHLNCFTVVRAEYRVFLLQIKNSKGEVLKEFTSNLDPIQYTGYVPIPLDQKISYSATWMCKGPTPHFKPYCENPNANARVPSAEAASSPPTEAPSTPGAEAPSPPATGVPSPPTIGDPTKAQPPQNP